MNQNAISMYGSLPSLTTNRLRNAPPSILSDKADVTLAQGLFSLACVAQPAVSPRKAPHFLFTQSYVPKDMMIALSDCLLHKTTPRTSNQEALNQPMRLSCGIWFRLRWYTQRRMKPLWTGTAPGSQASKLRTCKLYPRNFVNPYATKRVPDV